LTDARPLRGTTVAVTRARTQASDLVRRLLELGADVVETPVIRIEPLAGTTIDASAYDLVCLTSPNAPALLLERIGGDARLLAGVDVAAIGVGTAAAIRAIGILPDVVAERSVGEGLLEVLAGRVAGRRVLVARAEEARDTLPDGLHDAGAARVDIVALYRTVPETPTGTEALTAHLVTFTSASTVRFFAGAFADHDLSSVRGVSIGPITSSAMRELGIPIAAEAANHDLDGLVAAIVEAAGNR
jgi:uroporphyrinogen III methyltransferase/synthase